MGVIPILDVKLKKFEWRQMASFLSICPSKNLTHAAKRLNVSRTTLSERLAQFEHHLDLSLSIREDQSSCINKHGLSLAKYLMPLLSIEHFSTQMGTGQGDYGWIPLSIPLDEYSGALCHAVTQAIQKTQSHYPRLLLLPQFIETGTTSPSAELSWAPKWEQKGQIHLEWGDEGQRIPNAEHIEQYIFSPWCMLTHESMKRPSLMTRSLLSSLSITFPKHPWTLTKHAMLWAEHHQLTLNCHNTGIIESLNQTTDRSMVYLCHSLLVDQDKLPSGWTIHPLSHLSATGLVINLSGCSPALSYFYTQLNQALQAHGDILTDWTPKTSLRAWYYASHLTQQDTLSDIARRLFLSQSALSMQIKGLETHFREDLIEHKIGARQIRLTTFGQRFCELAQGAMQLLDDFLLHVEHHRLQARPRLVLGILPSIDTQSTFIRMFLQKLQTWSETHEGIQVELVEERHRYLVNALRNHEIHLAILEADSPWVESIPLPSKEAMGLVISHRLKAPIADSMSWDALGQFNLVLPRKDTGMRLIIDQHCRQLGIRLAPEMESDSLNINQHWVKQGKYATILPRSAVAQAIDANTVSFIPLHPRLDRVLRVSHLKKRVLSSAEKSLLQHLLHPYGGHHDE